MALVDIGMPPEGGVAALKAILVRRPDLGVIVMSGISPDLALRELLRTWGGVFLAKPFSPDDLVRAVEEVLEASQARRNQSPSASGRSSGE